ncbi:MAG: NAD(P)H-binding protein [Myxococcota bacterium]|nr:NAD(P)H-binding protein [Myxococcota bacterium]
MDRRLFVAGATGATGRTLVKIAGSRDIDLVPHLRPATAQKRPPDPRAAVFDLTNHDALVSALADRSTVLQLIGTMRKRFASGDTYETSDIGTTRALVEAARNTQVDHIVLLSSVGAGRPIGAYLSAKAHAEQLVRESGIDWTIFRPSSFDGAGHRPPWGVRGVTRALGLKRYEPIRIEDLAASLLHVAGTGSHRGEVLEGATLWAVVDEAREQGASALQLQGAETTR